MKGTNIPTKPGLYFARMDDVKWWHLIVSISGEHASYLRAIAWDRKDDRLVTIKYPEDLHYGLKINEPDYQKI